MQTTKIGGKPLSPTYFDYDPELRQIADEIAKKSGGLDLAVLERAYKEVKDPELGQKLKAMLRAAHVGKPKGTFANQAELRAATNQHVISVEGVSADAQRFRGLLDKTLV